MMLRDAINHELLEVLTVVVVEVMKIQDLWEMTLCGLVNV
jgi:hypothetical protein